MQGEMLLFVSISLITILLLFLDLSGYLIIILLHKITVITLTIAAKTILVFEAYSYHPPFIEFI